LNTELPGNLAEIFPLRLRLREPLRFQRSGDNVVTERASDGQRFSLRPWQYEMLCRLDGQRTFEEAGREVYGMFRGSFTSVGLLNFYRWLHHEDLIECDCPSIFELVESHTEAPVGEVTAPRNSSGDVASEREAASGGLVSGGLVSGGLVSGGLEAGEKGVSEVIRRMTPRREWQRKALKLSAIILFSLAVLRLAYVIGPVFEPPVNRLYAEIENYFYESVRPTSIERNKPDVPSPPEKEMALAGRAGSGFDEKVDEVESEPKSEPVSPSLSRSEPAPELQPEPLSRSNTEPLGVGAERIETGPVFDGPSHRLDTLRRRLAACRIRRDEFYIQNDEEGYREEVAKMSELAREIGELESELGW